MLKLGVASYPPTVEVKRKFFPIPDILASVNADPAVIREYVKENIRTTGTLSIFFYKAKHLLLHI